jgi:excisionase family DNA binding protein
MLQTRLMSAALTTRQAAERLGVTDSRVRHLVLEGRLPAEKFGRDLVIREHDLRLVKDRKVGRPPKQAQADTPAPTKAKEKRATKS